MKFLFALIVLIIFNSCNDPIKIYLDKTGKPFIFDQLPIKWRFDCEFPEENKHIVRNSFNYWESLIKTKLFKEENECGFSVFFDSKTKQNGIGIMLFPNQESIILNNQKLELWGRAPVSTFENGAKSGLILFYPIWDIEENDNIKESIARHEIGHILGFAHSLDTNCLMFEIVNKTNKKKDACLLEIVRLQELYGRKKWDR